VNTHHAGRGNLDLLLTRNSIRLRGRDGRFCDQWLFVDLNSYFASIEQEFAPICAPAIAIVSIRV